ncbi:MAG: DUF5615 family PIN-like protein [Bacteroidia bacterium]|nr:DUF5615 family PIN-like protein [Bacteroidia bacterium]
MKFIIDECTGPKVAQWLAEQYDVFSVYDEMRGENDISIIQKAFHEKRILITNDKDFGELVFKQNIPHAGIILLRLKDERTKNKITVLKNFFNTFHDNPENKFIIITDVAIRILNFKKHNYYE